MARIKTATLRRTLTTIRDFAIAALAAFALWAFLWIGDAMGIPM